MKGWEGPVSPKKGCLGMLQWVPPALMPSRLKGNRSQSPPIHHLSMGVQVSSPNTLGMMEGTLGA